MSSCIPLVSPRAKNILSGVKPLVRKNSPLQQALGAAGIDFLHYGLESLQRILPHTEVEWERPKRLRDHRAAARTTFEDQNHRAIRLRFELNLGDERWRIEGRLQRRKASVGVGNIARTLDRRELSLAQHAVLLLSQTLGRSTQTGSDSLEALRSTFDERVISKHVNAYSSAGDLGHLFVALRQLAEQSYENKALAFGCIVKPTREGAKAGPEFPREFFERKRYRALSDGYNTAYEISSHGRLLGFVRLDERRLSAHGFYPEWAEDLAVAAHAKRIAVALTRQGDLLVFDAGTLRFTYRFGRWQYWNHDHIIDLLTNSARVQKVPPNKISSVVRSIYRAALDVSFRRSGGLFVLLRNERNLKLIVPDGEAIGDVKRDTLDEAFDGALGATLVPTMKRGLLAELAGLDGAIVIGNTGRLLAYGAILRPRKVGRARGAEGSRTKAAIGASNYGLAIKVSSDGDISVYNHGDQLIRV